jgi:SPASM domain peptide maturase of grasp-with-spasm system
MRKHYKLFPHCIPVKGASRSTLCNLHDENYFFIPNDLHEVLDKYDTLNIEELSEDYGKKNIRVLQNYITVLVSNNCIFELNKKESGRFFPKFNLEFHSPSLIDNAVLDIDEKTQLHSTVCKLESVGCIAILLRITHEIDLNGLKETLDIFASSSVQHIDILIYKTNLIVDNELDDLFHSQVRLNSIVIYSSDKAYSRKVTFEKFAVGYIERIRKRFDNSMHCPSIGPSYFVLNIPHFTESLKYNNCLNKKVAIDTNGNIKNCPSMRTTFGNIETVDLEELATSNDLFKNLWSLNKDKIEGCKICEFRYICSDCRAFVEDVKDISSKPLTCGYDPTTETWSDWADNPLKKAAIEYYQKNSVS